MPGPTLPVELVDHILEHLYDQPASLALSALVHSSWTSPSQRLLYRTVVLSQRDCLALVTPLRISSHLRPYVRELFIYGTAWTILMHAASEVYGCSVADLFPCVHYLYISDVTIERFVDELVCFSHSMRQLSLVRCNLLPGREQLGFRLYILWIWRCIRVDRFLDAMVHSPWPMLDTLVRVDVQHRFFRVEVHAAAPAVLAHAVLRVLIPFEPHAPSPNVVVEWCNVTPRSTSIGLAPMLELLCLGEALSDHLPMAALFEILRRFALSAVHALTFTFSNRGAHGALDVTQPGYADRLAAMALPHDLAQRLRCVRLKFERFSEIRGYNVLLALLGMAGRTGVLEVDFGAAQVVNVG